MRVLRFDKAALSAPDKERPQRLLCSINVNLFGKVLDLSGLQKEPPSLPVLSVSTLLHQKPRKGRRFVASFGHPAPVSRRRRYSLAGGLEDAPHRRKSNAVPKNPLTKKPPKCVGEGFGKSFCGPFRLRAAASQAATHKTQNSCRRLSSRRAWWWTCCSSREVLALASLRLLRFLSFFLSFFF
jgi:hypothetical protein